MSTGDEPAHSQLPGETQLDADEANGLLPTHITTQAALNAWEQVNIARAEQWVFGARRRGVTRVLTVDFSRALHARMFDATWSWAGQYRRTEKNFGLPPSQIAMQLRECLENSCLWHEQHAYVPNELVARLHHRLVVIHPWSNGNGRWARLVADAYLHAVRLPRCRWGRQALTTPSEARTRYLAALREADRGRFESLIVFVRS